MIDVGVGEIPEADFLQVDKEADEILPCGYQAGGHALGKDGKAACLVDKNGRFYKAFQGGPRGQRELGLYKTVNAAATGLPLDLEMTPDALTKLRTDCQGLLPFMPKYYGVTKLDDQMLLIMEDLVHGCEKPCILDLKVGYTTGYTWASEESQARCKAKDESTMQGTMGFRACGYNLHKLDGSKVKTDKNWSYTMTAEKLPGALNEFANNGALSYADLFTASDGFIPMLKDLEVWCSQQTSLQFYAASVLFIYDGTGTTRDSAKIRLRLVDFAHSYLMPGEQDKNFLTGLQSIIRNLEEAVAK